jgi:hypothetical protein
MRRLAAGAVIGALVAATAGCSHSAGGRAEAPGSGGPRPDYPKLMKECSLVADNVIAQSVGADVVEATFTGAICRWDGLSSAGTVLISLNWFETGSLRNERAVNEELHYRVTPITVQGGGGLREQRPNDPDSCGVTVAAVDNGVIGWWVQYMPGSTHPDPCQAAQKLAEASLTLNR